MAEERSETESSDERQRREYAEREAQRDAELAERQKPEHQDGPPEVPGAPAV